MGWDGWGGMGGMDGMVRSIVSGMGWDQMRMCQKAELLLWMTDGMT